jgi:hypothetical protein
MDDVCYEFKADVFLFAMAIRSWCLCTPGRGAASWNGFSSVGREENNTRKKYIGGAEWSRKQPASRALPQWPVCCIAIIDY